MIDMNDIMKKAQELSENMKLEQEELAKQTFTVSVGGEMVKMTFNGKQEAKSYWRILLQNFWVTLSI